MALSKVIWEQVFPEDAEIRIQQAFEMLLGEEFGLTNSAQSVQLGTTVDRCYREDYNQGNEKQVTKSKGNRRAVKGIQKVSSQVSMG